MLLILFYLLVILHMLHLGNLLMPIMTHKKPVRKNHRPGFSIVIAAKDEYENLKKLVPLLLRQKYPEFEIIVVLDRCSDSSENYLDSLKKDNSQLRVVKIEYTPPGFDGKKYALTRAIDLASNEWVLLTDADCLPHSDLWIKNFAENVDSRTSILIGVSPYVKKASMLNQFIQYETIYTAMKYMAAAISRKPFMAVGRNMAYKKSLFLSGNGFEPFQYVTGGDDDLFVQKYATGSNTRVVLGPESLTYSYASSTISQYITQKTRHLHVGKYYKEKATHIYLALLHAALWLCFISLMLADPVSIGVISTFILLIVIKGLIFNLTSRKMGFYYNPFLLPISDLIYAIIYPFIGIRALLHTKVKWK